METVMELFAEGNIPENLRMLQRVMVKLKEDTHNPDGQYDGTYLERAAKYTGLQIKVLEGLKNTNEYQIEEFKEINRGVIYDKLASFYLTEKYMPTTKQLFEALYEKIPPYVDIRSFRKTLVKLGFMWKRKNSTDNACVVIERPTIIFDRYEYLKNILNYRNEGKPIYFIDENALASNGEYLSQEQSKLCFKNETEAPQRRVIYAVSKMGIHSVKFIDSFDEQNFTEWLVSDLLPNIDVPSVIVINNSKHHCEQIIQPPNKESLKIEICNWLEYNNIPFDSEMSKYELLDLTENFTDVEENMHKIERIVKEKGHTVLRIPDCIKKLTPANLVCDLIKKNKELFFTNDNSSEAAFTEAVESIPIEIFSDYDKYITSHVEDILNKDVEIDKVLDDLLKNMTDLPMTNDDDTDIPSCSDSD